MFIATESGILRIECKEGVVDMAIVTENEAVVSAEKPSEVVESAENQAVEKPSDKPEPEKPEPEKPSDGPVGDIEGAAAEEKHVEAGKGGIAAQLWPAYPLLQTKTGLVPIQQVLSS